MGGDLTKKRQLRERKKKDSQPFVRLATVAAAAVGDALVASNC